MFKQHTQTPWIVSAYEGMPVIRCNTPEDPTEFDAIATLSDEQPDPEANAAFIVRACNSHEALVESLNCLVEYLENCGQKEDASIKSARAAMALADKEG